METAGVMKMYSRSVRLNKLRYTTYRGDGDSKSFQEVQSSNPYPGYPIVKSECVGHVQKESAHG